MRPDDEDHPISDLSLERLAQEKVAARQELLSMPPERAQQRVEQTLYPQYWQWCSEELSWNESIPTHYGEIDT